MFRCRFTVVFRNLLRFAWDDGAGGNCFFCCIGGSSVSGRGISRGRLFSGILSCGFGFRGAIGSFLQFPDQIGRAHV